MKFLKKFWFNSWHLTLFAIANIIAAFYLREPIWLIIVTCIWLIALFGSLYTYKKRNG